MMCRRAISNIYHSILHMSFAIATTHHQHINIKFLHHQHNNIKFLTLHLTPFVRLIHTLLPFHFDHHTAHNSQNLFLMVNDGCNECNNLAI